MFTLTLVTPERRMVAGAEIEEVFVPGDRGELNILPGHAPLMTTLRPGIVRYRLKGESVLHRVAVSSGYAQVNGLGVNVLAETAERAEDLNPSAIDAALAEAEARLTALDATTEELEAMTHKIEVARVQKQLVTGAASTDTH
jgi:F-type H+-transporting ATPase subunit epsilon